MKIATLNINNINKRLANLLDWLRTSAPDIVALQELKAADAEFPEAELKEAGYHAVWVGQKSWNGVALLARGAEPIVTRRSLPGDPMDTQARYIEAAVNGVLATSLYAPNGNPQPGPKFEYKLAWMKRLLKHAETLKAAGAPVVLAGDYNVVPTAADIYPTKSYDMDALLQPEPRALHRRLLDGGWTDAIRALYPDAPMYSYWSYFRNRWPRDAGLRIDHLLLNDESARRLVSAGVDRDTRGHEGTSDHAPVWIELSDKPRRIRARTPGKSKPTSGLRRPDKVRARNDERVSVIARPRSGRGDPAAPVRKTNRPLLVVDGDSFAHRSYHGVPKSIMRKGDRPANAILGFANFLLRLYREEQPRAVIVAWDTLEVPTYRHKAFKAYQSGRKFDAALLEQLAVIPEFIAACGFVNAKAPGYEADDFLAAAVAAEQRRGTVLVASGDRDTFQLASDRTTILYPVRAGEMARIGPAQVRERYDVEPAQVPDFIAIRGDPSDKLPGASGMGPRGAASILHKYGSLEKALAAGRFAKQADELRLYRSIATMDKRAPLPSLRAQKPTWAKAAALARAWQLNQLAKRLEELAG